MRTHATAMKALLDRPPIQIVPGCGDGMGAREEGILLLARTDACRSRGFAEALARLKQFEAEGADILFRDSPESKAQRREAVAACNGKPCTPDNPGLAAAGIKSAIFPQDIPSATVRAIRAALAGLKGGEPAPMATLPDLATAIRTAEYLTMDGKLAAQ